jgi:DnaJ-domain-containing protein 1
MLLTTYFGNTPVEEGGEMPIAIFVMLIIGMLIGITIYLSNDYFQTRKWKLGLFPLKLPYSRDNLSKVYICLSASLVRRNLSESLDKTEYMYTVLEKEFSRNRESVKNAFNFSLKHPIQIQTVCNWLNEKIIDDLDRMRIIFFLAHQSMVNGTLLNNEYALLHYLTNSLQLEQSDLDSVIATLAKQNKKQKSKKSAGKNQNKKDPKTSPSKIDSYYKLFGLDKTATLQEIKKSYRKLVMNHHPDKFDSATPDQLKKAQNRFLKIQEAYEYFEQKML